MAAAMTMPDYLDQIRHAVEGLLPLLWTESQRLADLAARFEFLETAATEEYRDIARAAVGAEDADDDGLVTFRTWDNYFGPDKDADTTAIEHDKVAALIEVRRFSTEAIAGSIIQFAKQGLVLTWGGKPNPAIGRSMGSQLLSDVVWAARNQSLHWEEHNLNEIGKRTFNALATDFDPVFAEFNRRNLGFEVVTQLGWKTVADFETDMMTLV